MGLAEEEVLIRDDSGLLMGDGESQLPRRYEWFQKLSQTMCLSVAFFVLGLCVAIPGPTLLDLGDQVDASTAQMMIVFVTRSFGYLIGALIGGVLFDTFNKQLLLFCTLLLSSVATMVIPWSLTLIVMATMFALQGVTMGVLDTGGNIFCIQIWGKKNGPYIQMLHFAFGIGAFLAPLLARPFLSPSAVTYGSNTSIVQGNIPVSPYLHHQLLNRSHRVDRSIDEFSALDRLINSFESNDDLIREKRSFIPNDLYVVNNLDSYDRNLDDKYLLKIHGNRLKRQTNTGGKDDSDGLWKWKRQQSKREAGIEETTTKAPDISTVIGTVSNNIDKQSVNGNSNISKPGHDVHEAATLKVDSVPGVKQTEEGAKAIPADTGSVPQGINPDKKNLQNDSDSISNIDKTNVTIGMSGNKDTSENQTTAAPMTTVTMPTTTEEFKKPVAASDQNRDKVSADGSLMKDYLKTAHKETDTEPELSLKKKVEPTTISPETTVDAETINATQTDKPSNGIEGVDLPLNVTNDNKTDTTTGVQANSSVPLLQRNASAPLAHTPVGNEVTPKPHKPTKSTTTTPSTTTTTKATTTKATTTTTTTKETTTTTTTTKATTTTTMIKTPTLSGGGQHHINKPNTDNQPSTKVTTQTMSDTQNITVSSNVTKSTTSNSENGQTTPAPRSSTTEISTKPQTAVGNIIEKVKHMSRIQIAYMIIGVALLVQALVFLVLYCKNKRRFATDIELERTDGMKATRMCYKGTLVILLGLFFFCYVGLEVTYGALVTTFSVDYNGWPKEQGATVAAIFWGSLATGRGLSIFIAACCGPTFMLSIDSVFMIIGGLTLSFGIQYYDKLLWLGTLFLGLGMSSVFPAGISWAEKYFQLSGKSTAVFVIGSALGQMIVPTVIGYFLEYTSAMVLMYATLALSVAATAIFIIMQCVAVGMNRHVSARDRNGFLPLEDDDDDDHDREVMEMDLVHFDRSSVKKRRRDTRGGGDAQYHTLISDLDDD